jgi:Condensation domain
MCDGHPTAERVVADSDGQSSDGRHAWPVTLNQARLLAVAELHAQHGRPFAANRVEVASVRGRVDDAALSEALVRVVQRHGALRSTFGPSSHVPAAAREWPLLTFDAAGVFQDAWYEQRVGTPGRVDVAVTDLPSAALDRREACVADIVRQEHRTSFSLDGTPQLRAHLVRFESSESALVLAVPSLVADSASVDLIWRDLVAEYAALGGRGAAPSARAPQFHEFAAWQTEQLCTASFDTSLTYWREVWDRFEAAQLGASDFSEALPSAPGAAVSGDIHRARSGSALAASVRTTAEAAGVAPSILFMSAFFLLLRAMTGRDRLAVWVGLSNRSGMEEHEETVGWLANHHIIGLDVAASASAPHLLEACRSTVVAAQRHEGLPLPRLWRQMGRIAEQWPRLVFDWRIAGPYVMGDLSVAPEPMVCPPLLAPTGLALTVTEYPSDFVVTLGYSARYFRRDVIAAALSWFCYRVAALAASPGARLQGLV